MCPSFDLSFQPQDLSRTIEDHGGHHPSVNLHGVEKVIIILLNAPHKVHMLQADDVTVEGEVLRIRNPLSCTLEVSPGRARAV